MKDYKLNRINDCFLTPLYRIADIIKYFQRFENSTNNMAILGRRFVEIRDVLKPVYSAAALLGVHVLRPFYQLLIDPSTTYSSF